MKNNADKEIDIYINKMGWKKEKVLKRANSEKKLNKRKKTKKPNKEIDESNLKRPQSQKIFTKPQNPAKLLLENADKQMVELNPQEKRILTSKSLKNPFKKYRSRAKKLHPKQEAVLLACKRNQPKRILGKGKNLFIC